MTGGYARSAALIMFLNCRSRGNVIDIRAASLLTFLIVIRDLA